MESTINILNYRHAFYILTMTWFVVFWQEISNAFSIYAHSGYDYQGLFVPMLIILMCRYKNSSLKRTTPNYSKFGLLILLFVILSWQCAEIAQLNTVKYLTMFSMLPAIVLITCGKKITQVLGFQLICLLLLMPFGQETFIYLQNLFARLTVNVLSLIAHSVYWDGNNIYLGTHQYVISSIFISQQYFMLYLTSGSLLAFLTSTNFLHRILIALNFISLPVIFLFVTFTTLILTQQNLSAQSLVIISWACTLIGLSTAVYICTRLMNNTNVINGNSDIDWKNAYPSPVRSMTIPIILGVIMLSSNAAIKQITFEPKFIDNLQLHAPDNLATWGQPIVVADEHGPGFIAEYRKNKQSIFLASSDARVSNQLSNINNQEWEPIKSNINKTTVNKSEMKVVETVLRNKDISRIVWTFYTTNGKFTANQQHRFFLERIYSIFGQDVASTATTIATHVDTDLNAGRSTLNAFLNEYMVE